MARRMNPQTLLKSALGIALSFGVSACGAEFDPPSELKSLRVLGVQKDKPYARPGDDVTVKMLWHDGSDAAGRKIERAFLSGCFNPLGDLYAGCFASFDPSTIEMQTGDSDEFTFTIPEDIITSRPPPPDPRQPPYGLAYLFFAVCAGTLEAVEPTADAGFPLRCVDDEGTPLDADDFVVGYSQIYVYDEFTNENPSVTGFAFRDVEYDTADMFTCVGDECLAGALGAIDVDSVDCEEQGTRCIPACAEDGDVLECDEYPLRPLIDSASVEPDSVSAAAYGRNYEEQMWVNYYVTRGSVRSDIRLVNDATAGFNEDYGTKFYAPKEPGPVRLFAVVHDNRGGMSWSGTTIWVK